MRALVLMSLAVACGRTDLESRTLVAPASTGHTTNQGAAGRPSSGGHDCAWGFAPPVTYPGGVAPSTVAIGDLDGDGHADIAVNNYGGGPDGLFVQVLRNKGDGTFGVDVTVKSTVAFSMAVGPFVSTHNDLLVGCDLFENDGKSRFGAAITYGTPCGAQDSWRNLATADFDADGKLDFAWGFSNSAVVYLNRGGGKFVGSVVPLSADSLHVTTLASADFDRDGLPDLAAACWGYGNPNLLDILHNRGGGSFDVTTLDTGETSLTSIAAGDMDGDGYADVVTTAAPGGLELRFHEPDGSFSSPVSYSSGFTNPILMLGDINGDAATDVVVADENGTGLSYFLNLGDGTLDQQVFLPLHGSLWNATLGDLNGDGHLDIVAAETLSEPGGYAEVWLSRCE